MHFDKTIVGFFVLFLSVYFLESIGGFFMTSAIVSIEKQFQIPSKISGMMVSAGDFGYIPSVVFVSYLGGKGNRAKWIGGGCVLIAVSNLLISASNFLFPVETVSLNNSYVYVRISAQNLQAPFGSAGSLGLERLTYEIDQSNTLDNTCLTNLVTHYEESWLSQFEHCDQLEANNQTDVTCQAFYNFLSRHNSATKDDVDNLRMLSATSYAFCDVSLNRLRTMIQSIRCTRNVSNLAPVVTIFLGLLFLGVGRTMPFSLGLPLIDDNVRKKNLPIYFAGMFFIRIMGPVVGFLMGSFFNKFYYTGDAPRGITPRDPMWIGMWWGGFLVIGLVLFGPSLALFCFKAPQPEEDENKEESTNLVNGNVEEEKAEINGKESLLEKSGIAPLAVPERDPKKPAKSKTRGLALVDRHVEKGLDGNTVVPESLKDKVKDFAQTISTVIRQPVYAGTLVGRILDVMAFKGFFIFLPKYLELQFGIPQYKINAYMGVIGVVGFATGILIGSVALKIWKFEGRKVAAWVAICSGLAACLSFMNASVGCRSTLTTLGDALPHNFNMNSSCLSGCGCEGAPLYPVCDSRGTVYYSPCHAGCRLNALAFSALNPKLTPTFSDCRCAGNENVSREFCQDSDCEWKVKWYFANMAISGIIGGMGVIPGVLIMLRSVPPKHRSVSLGFNGFLVSLFATLPSPIIWGAIIDHFCIHWDKKCDDQGACSLYATNRLRVWLHCIYGAIRLISLITDVFVVYHAKGLKITDSALDEDEEGMDTPAKESSEISNEDQRDSKKKLAIEIGKAQEKEPLNDKAIESKKEEAAFLPLHLTSTQPESMRSGGTHSRSPSRDYTGQGAKQTTRKQSDELNLLRKNSNHIAGRISEF